MRPVVELLPPGLVLAWDFSTEGVLAYPKQLLDQSYQNSTSAVPYITIMYYFLTTSRPFFFLSYRCSRYKLDQLYRKKIISMNDNLTFFLAPVFSAHSHNQNHISKSFFFLVTRRDSEAQGSFVKHRAIEYHTVLVKIYKKDLRES